MKNAITTLIVVVAIWIGWQFYQNWEPGQGENKPGKHSNKPPGYLPGMPHELESSLSMARARGAEGLRQWLAAYGSRVKDPRLAAIQLDYVVLVFRDNPAEARRVFNLVRERVGPESPVYERVQQYAPTYE